MFRPWIRSENFNNLRPPSRAKISRLSRLGQDYRGPLRPVVLDAAAIAERIDRAGYQTRVLSSTSDSDD
jgi:hypothetical protein